MRHIAMRTSQASTPFLPEAMRCRRVEWRLGALRQTTGGQGGRGGDQDWPASYTCSKASCRGRTACPVSTPCVMGRLRATKIVSSSTYSSYGLHCERVLSWVAMSTIISCLIKYFADVCANLRRFPPQVARRTSSTITAPYTPVYTAAHTADHTRHQACRCPPATTVWWHCRRYPQLPARYRSCAPIRPPGVVPPSQQGS